MERILFYLVKIPRPPLPVCSGQELSGMSASPYGQNSGTNIYLNPQSWKII